MVVTMGLNDNFSYAPAGSGIRDQIDADFAYLTDELPDARIVVVEPFWYTDTRPESVEVIIGWVRDAAEEIGVDWIPGASRWIKGHPEWMAADGFHPNDDGYAEMARMPSWNDLPLTRHERRWSHRADARWRRGPGSSPRFAS